MTVGDSFRSALLFFILGNVHRDRDSFNYYRFPTGESQELHRRSLPEKPANHLRIIVVSDTHNRHDRLGNIPDCDLFVHCGDILMTGKRFSANFQLGIMQHFDDWLSRIPAERKLVVGGNHDEILFKLSKEERKKVFKNAEYIENESIRWKGAHIWASPISFGKSPNKAFQSGEFEEEFIGSLPSEVDILITHGHHPKIMDNVQYKVHLYGHNHNSYGIQIDLETRSSGDTRAESTPLAQRVSICAPICDGRYRLQQLPVVIDYPLTSTTYTAVNSTIVSVASPPGESVLEAPPLFEKSIKQQNTSSSNVNSLQDWALSWIFSRSKVVPTDRQDDYHP